MNRWLALGAVGALLAGCSTLSVQVDVLQPAYLHAAALDEQLWIEVHQLASGREADREADAFISRQKAIYQDFRSKCLNGALEQAKALSPGKTHDMYVAQYSAVIADKALQSQIDANFEAARGRLYALNQKTEKEVVEGYGSSLGEIGLSTPVPPGLRAILLNRRQAFADERAAVFRFEVGQSDFCTKNLPVPVPSSVDKAVSAQVNAQSSSAANDTLLGGGQTLVADVGAFDAVAADKHAWAPKFNKSSGWGFGGNTDIAVKLNSTGDFTVKGFVFDGRSTAEMVSKVGIQAVSTIAQAYGLPVAAPSPSGGAGAGPAVVPSTAAADSTTIATAQADDAAYRAALFRVVDLVLANPDGIKADNSPEAAAVRAAIATDAAHWTLTQH